MFAGLRIAAANVRARLRNSRKFRLFVAVLNDIVEEDKPRNNMALTKIQKIGVAGIGMFFFSFFFSYVMLPPIVKHEVKKVYRFG